MANKTRRRVIATTGCPVCQGTTGRNTKCTRRASCKVGCVRLCWQHAVAYEPKTATTPGKCVPLLAPSTSTSSRRQTSIEPVLQLSPAVKSLNKDVVVKRSTIPAAGKGLFALKPFAVGDVVATYGGVVMHADEWKRLPANKRYYGMAIEGQTNFIVDGTKSYGIHMGRWVNDPYNTNHAVNVKSKWNNNQKRVELKATKAIAKGAEIFINYGPGYHQHL